MDDRTRVAAAMMLGAAAGGVLGYLYLTESGRQTRLRVEPWLDDVTAEIRRLRSTIEKARSAANEGWRSLNEVVGDTSSRSLWDRAPARSTSH